MCSEGQAFISPLNSHTHCRRDPFCFWLLRLWSLYGLHD